MISVVGFVGGEGGTKQVPTLIDTWMNLYTICGIWLAVGCNEKEVPSH
jgi:hypothetical protein